MKKTAVAVLCILFAYVLSNYVLSGEWAVYGPMLISYHLFLVYLVLTADHERGLSLPIHTAVLTHAACMVIPVGMAMGRSHFAFFGLLQYVVPALAPFEADWLFSGGKKSNAEEAVEAPKVPMPEGTADDYDEFLKYLSQKNRAFARPGRTVREEHVLWMANRVKKEAAIASAAAAAAARQHSAHPAPR
jgi:hypothetical protein